MSSQPLTRAAVRHRHRASRSRYRGRTVALLVTVTIVAVATTGLAWWGFQARGAVSCGDDPVRLRVVTSPSLMGPITKAATTYEQAKPRVAGACVSVDVRPMNVTQVEGALVSAAQRQGDASFDVWIPESTTWAQALSRRPEVDKMLPSDFTVLASSPVVAAMPTPMAEAIGHSSTPIELADLVALAQDPRGWSRFGHPAWGRVRVGWQAPQTSPIGLDGLMTMFASLGKGNASPDQLRAGLLRVQNALTELDVTSVDAFKPLSDPGLGTDEALAASMIVPSTEREVQAFNATTPRIPLTAVPVGTSGTTSKVGYISLFDTVLDRRRAVAAAESFREYLVSAKGRPAFVDDGWRVASLLPGTSAAAAPGYPPPSVSSVTRALQSWSALRRRGSVLLVVDVSGSMKQKVASSSLTRLQLAQQALSSAVVSFSSRSSLGLWEFSRTLNGSKDYRVVVPLGPSSDAVGPGTRQEAVRSGIAKLTARGDTGLYDTALAAVREMQRKWTPDTDVVVLLSDGRNEDPGSISLKDLTATLTRERVKTQPVRVFTIAYGQQADAGALAAIAKATGGASYTAQSPTDIERVLLASLTD